MWKHRFNCCQTMDIDSLKLMKKKKKKIENTTCHITLVIIVWHIAITRLWKEVLLLAPITWQPSQCLTLHDAQWAFWTPTCPQRNSSHWTYEVFLTRGFSQIGSVHLECRWWCQKRFQSLTDLIFAAMSGHPDIFSLRSHTPLLLLTT